MLAFVALMTVPLLYGGMYLWGNLDPYGNLKHVPAAHRRRRQRARTTDGAHVNRGRDAADDARASPATSPGSGSPPSAAKRQLETGGVDFVVTFPALVLGGPRLRRHHRPAAREPSR